MADRASGAGRPGKAGGLDKDQAYWLKVVGGVAAVALAGYAVLRYTGKDKDVEREADKVGNKARKESNKLFH